MRVLLRLAIVVALLVGAGFLLLGYWAGRHDVAVGPSSNTVGTTGTAKEPPPAARDTSGTLTTAREKARQTGAELGEKAADASAKLQETVAEGAITAKIKAKMALDDMVKSRTIDVSTNGSTVTLSGTVRSAAERDRALGLARETSGVTQVVDHLSMPR
jgi:hyperosmotically inducible protein